MKNNVSLDHLAKRELDAIKAIDLRKLLLNSLKNEAYDDAALDNMWVANVEKEVPGIITAYSGDHNFATSSPEENHRVIMEALDSGTAIKAGIIGAIILLIYKVYRVMTNNSAFSGGGGGGGRGTVTHTTQMIEELKSKGIETSNAMDKAKEAAALAEKNKLNHEDDSAVHRAGTRLISSVGEEPKEQNPFTAIKNMSFNVGYRSVGELPIYILQKNDSDFENVFTLYNELVAIAVGKSSAFDFHTVNQKITSITDTLLTGSKDAKLAIIASPDGVKGLTDLYSQYVGSTLGKVLNDPQLTNAKLISVVRNGLSRITMEIGELTTQLKSLDNPMGVMSKDDIIKDLDLGILGQGTSKILDRCKKIAQFNDQFGELMKDYSKDFDDSSSSTLKEEIISNLNRVLDQLGEEYNPTETSAIKAAVGELKAMYELIQVQVLGSIFKFRMNTDKIDKFFDLCLKDLMSVMDNSISFVSSIQNSEDF